MIPLFGPKLKMALRYFIFTTFKENEMKTERETQRVSIGEFYKDWGAPQGILCTKSLRGSKERTKS